MNIVAPINSKNWTVTKGKIYQPFKVRIEWREARKISPSLQFENRGSSITVEIFSPKKKARK